MNIYEFSNQFDTEVSAYAKLFDNQTDVSNYLSSILQFDEYEKSLFLTKAQESFIIACYTGRNPAGHAFEITEEDKKTLSSLIKTVELEPNEELGTTPISKNSYFFRLPSNVLFVTYESCKFSNDDKCLNGKEVEVIPVTQDEFHRVKNNPFRGFTDNRVLRLDAGKNIVELVSKYDIDKYLLRYISKPNPIILIDLEDDLSINNIQNESECQLPDFTHQRILDLAVQMALQSRSIGLNNNK